MHQPDAVRRALILQEGFICPSANLKLALFLVMCNRNTIHWPSPLSPARSSSADSTRNAPGVNSLFLVQYLMRKNTARIANHVSAATGGASVSTGDAATDHDPNRLASR